MTEKYSLIRLPVLLKLTGLSKSTVYARLQEGSRYYDPSFPKPVKLSANGRIVAWILPEVEKWIENLMAFRS